MDKPRVVLIGLGPTALTALESLVDVVEVIAVIRPQHGLSWGDDPVVARAQECGIRLYPETQLAAIVALLDRLCPACTVISSYNRILPAEVLRRHRCVNVHYAPLPTYRGRANVNWAVINCETDTAISIHTLAPGVDAGAILFQQSVPIGRDTVTDVYQRLNAIQQEVLGRVVLAYLHGTMGQVQDETQATYGCTRTPDDGEIQWSASTQQIDALIRGLAAPYPGAFTYLDGQRLTIVQAEPVVHPPTYVGRIPGRVVGYNRQTGSVDVLTGDGILRLLLVRRDSGRDVAATTYLHSTQQTLGLQLGQLLARIAALEADIADLRSLLQQKEQEASWISHTNGS